MAVPPKTPADTPAGTPIKTLSTPPADTVAKPKAKTAKLAPKKTGKTVLPTPHDTEENEVLRETRAAIAHRKDTGNVSKGDDTTKRDWKTAAGIGVGSAALLAALLYANRQKK